MILHRHRMRVVRTMHTFGNCTEFTVIDDKNVSIQIRCSNNDEARKLDEGDIVWVSVTNQGVEE